MPSPFPGMDPYLESADVWVDLHNALAGEIRAALNTLLPPGYYAQLEERTEILSEESEEPGGVERRNLFSDVGVGDADHPDGGVADVDRNADGTEPGDGDLRGAGPAAVGRGVRRGACARHAGRNPQSREQATAPPGVPAEAGGVARIGEQSRGTRSAPPRTTGVRGCRGRAVGAGAGRHGVPRAGQSGVGAATDVSLGRLLPEPSGPPLPVVPVPLREGESTCRWTCNTVSPPPTIEARTPADRAVTIVRPIRRCGGMRRTGPPTASPRGGPPAEVVRVTANESVDAVRPLLRPRQTSADALAVPRDGPVPGGPPGVVGLSQLARLRNRRAVERQITGRLLRGRRGPLGDRHRRTG